MANHNQDIATPIEFVNAVENHFNIKFEYDLAADETNKKAKMFFTKEQNSLNIEWPKHGWCWLNPPFKNLTKWIDKCVIESYRGSQIISIWPLSGDLNQINVWKRSWVHVVHGRIWPHVRSIMLCVWNRPAWGLQSGLYWHKEENMLTREW